MRWKRTEPDGRPGWAGLRERVWTTRIDTHEIDVILLEFGCYRVEWAWYFVATEHATGKETNSLFQNMDAGWVTRYATMEEAKRAAEKFAAGEPWAAQIDRRRSTVYNSVRLWKEDEYQ